MISLLKSVITYSLLTVGALVLLLVWVFAWFLTIGGLLMGAVWLAGEIDVSGWLILVTAFTGVGLLTSANHLLN